jgi:hypothetical protein
VTAAKAAAILKAATVKRRYAFKARADASATCLARLIRRRRRRWQRRRIPARRAMWGWCSAESGAFHVEQNFPKQLVAHASLVLHSMGMNNESMKPTSVEVSRVTVEFTESTPFGPYDVRRTTIIRKQTWPEGCGVYSGKSYELGSVFDNGNLVNDWSQPWGQI